MITQPMHSALISSDRCCRSYFSIHLLIWLGSLSILSGGLVKAQTSPDMIIPAALESPPAQVAPVVPESSPQSVAKDHSVSVPPLALPDPIPSRNDAYIAPTDYSIGATSSYHEPNATVDNPQSSGSGGSDEIAGNARGISVSDHATDRRNGYTPTRLSYSRYTGYRSMPSGLTAFNTVTTTQAYGDRSIRVIPRLGNSNIRLIFPLSIPASITSLFGWRIHPISGEPRFHSGVDLGAPLGTPVLAAYAGQVVLADWFGGYGLAITLGHNKDTQDCRFAHF